MFEYKITSVLEELRDAVNGKSPGVVVFAERFSVNGTLTA